MQLFSQILPVVAHEEAGIVRASCIAKICGGLEIVVHAGRVRSKAAASNHPRPHLPAPVRNRDASESHGPEGRLRYWAPGSWSDRVPVSDYRRHWID